MKNVRIIGFVGLPFTGKSTAREITEKLLDQKNIAWFKSYFGGHVVQEVERRNDTKEWGPEHLHLSFQQKEKYIRELLREQYGLGAMAKLSLHEINLALSEGKVILIDDLYSEEEREILAEKYGEENLTLVAMAADWNVRVERAKHRPHRPLNEEELASRDKAEIYNLHKAPPIALAHFTIVNNSFDKSDFEKSKQILRHEIETRVLPSINLF
jgi:dephospho-CoA kinase